jgi:hypothetical protein
MTLKSNKILVECFNTESLTSKGCLRFQSLKTMYLIGTLDSSMHVRIASAKLMDRVYPFF